MELKRKNIRLKNYDYSKEGYYYITICIKDRKEILSKIGSYNAKSMSDNVGVGVPDDPKKIHIKLTTYGEIIEKQIKEINNIYKDIKIENYIIMPNHVHMIIELARQENGSSRTPTPTNAKIPIIVSTLKRLTNKEIENKIWQRNYYEHIIRNEKEYYEIIKYMKNNPIRWIEKEGENKNG